MKPQVELNRVQNTLALRSGERAREAMDGLWVRGERTKHQIPTTRLQRNPNLQIPKPDAASLPWSLGLGASLVFGVWCLGLSSALALLAGCERKTSIDAA